MASAQSTGRTLGVEELRRRDVSMLCGGGIKGLLDSVKAVLSTGRDDVPFDLGSDRKSKAFDVGGLFHVKLLGGSTPEPMLCSVLGESLTRLAALACRAVWCQCSATSPARA